MSEPQQIEDPQPTTKGSPVGQRKSQKGSPIALATAVTPSTATTKTTSARLPTDTTEDVFAATPSQVVEPISPPRPVAPSGEQERKRRALEESILLPEEDTRKAEARRAYNRECAARARKRNKDLVVFLQNRVKELENQKLGLERTIEVMRAQMQVLEQQNRSLLMNQQQQQQQQFQQHPAGPAGPFPGQPPTYAYGLPTPHPHAYPAFSYPAQPQLYSHPPVSHQDVPSPIQPSQQPTNPSSPPLPGNREGQAPPPMVGYHYVGSAVPPSYSEVPNPPQLGPLPYTPPPPKHETGDKSEEWM